MVLIAMPYLRGGVYESKVHVMGLERASWGMQAGCIGI